MNTKSDRRDFIKKAAVLTGAVSVAGNSVLALSNIKNMRIHSPNGKDSTCLISFPQSQQISRRNYRRRFQVDVGLGF